MAKFILSHRHAPGECRVAFAAWRGFDSPLRHRAVMGSCEGADGAAEHSIWWEVEAADAEAALAQLPPFVADRTDVAPVSEVAIP